jgi:hypothetical protein
MSEDIKIIKSYVWHGERCFFVSTIERDSSSMLGPTRFYETIVWEYDWDKPMRGAQIYMDGGLRGFLAMHFAICQRLHSTGNPEQQEREQS